MTIQQYLIKARQDDARRAGEQDRLLLEARRARKPRSRHADPAVRAGRLARLMEVSRPPDTVKPPARRQAPRA
jgi:hypothetical protein